MIGVVVGSYRITSKLGEGGMGVVYTAEHTLLGKPAAVKVLLPQFSHNKEIVGRFFNEAKASTSVRHPGIIEVFDFGYHSDGSAFIVMEFLEGESLEARIHRIRPMPETQALALTRQIAGALGAAHQVGIVHRDLKPDNVFLVPDADISGGERAKVLDFGIAKLSGDTGVEATRTGAVMGTPAYMSPEQCMGARKVDNRSDLYSLGCILFEMLCGRRPFVAEGVGEIMGKHMYEPPPAPSSLVPAISPELEAMLLQLLAKDPSERYQTVAALVAGIDALTAGRFKTGQVSAATDPTRIAPGDAPQPAAAAALSGPPGTLRLAAPQTTLGAAAGAVQLSTATGEHDRGRSRGLLLAGALAAIVIVAGGSFMLMGRNGGDEGDGRTAALGKTAAEQDSEARAAPVTAAHQPTNAVATGPAAEPASAARPASAAIEAPVIELELDIEPRNARIRIDNVDVVTNPLRLAKSNQVRELTISADGYKPETRQVRPSGDGTLRVSLVPIKGSAKPPARRSPKAPTASAPQTGGSDETAKTAPAQPPPVTMKREGLYMVITTRASPQFRGNSAKAISDARRKQRGAIRGWLSNDTAPSQLHDRVEAVYDSGTQDDAYRDDNGDWNLQMRYKI